VYLCPAQTALIVTNIAMKLLPKSTAGTLLPILAGTIIFSLAEARAAVSLSVDPSAITNDFQGKITLAISNVTPGGTVTVQRYADLNGNGIIDAGEPLVLSFKVTDGHVPLINGVRNFNVPGDEDGLTNGQIRVELFVPSVDVALPAALKSIFKVTDPANSSATQPFTVSQKLYPQGVRGQIRAAANGMEVGHAIVVLASQSTSSALVSETDTFGNYTFYCLAGAYVVQTLADGFIDDDSIVINVNCGEFVTNNLRLAAANLTIAGKVSDSLTGAGIPGIFVDAKSTNNLRADSFTDTNGNYSLRVTSTNIWSVRADKTQPALQGYVALAKRTGVSVTSANVSNVNFQLPQATALIYGTIKDDRSNPVIGLAVIAQDLGSPKHEADGLSLVTDSKYALGVVAGTWTVGDEFALLGYPGQMSNVTVAAGQALPVNFVVPAANFPGLSAPQRLSNSQFQFLLQVTAGQTYTIQASTDLNAGNWLCLLVTNAPSNLITIVDSHATNRSRFYRALLGP